MASYQFDIQALNDIDVDYGGVGGFTFNIQALNDWAVRLGGAGGRTFNIDALNDIAGFVGAVGAPFSKTIDALNAISAALGGLSNYKFDIDALNAIADLPVFGSSSVPVNSVVPAVSGNTQVGQTLSTTNGTWSNSPTGYAYQWKRNGSSIGSATSSSYVLVELDAGAQITCAVTASNGSGSGSPAGSNALTIDVYLVAVAHVEDPTDLTTYSGGVWNGVAIGVAAANRIIVICPVARNLSAGGAVSSSSVGGAACAKVDAYIEAVDANKAEIWAVPLAAGTTANISITWSVGQTRCGATVYAMYGAGGIGAHDRGGAILDNTAVTLNVPAQGVAIGASIVTNGTAPTITWTGLTVYQTSQVEAGVVEHSSARLSSNAGGDVLMKNDWSANATDPASVYATWGLWNETGPSGARTWFNTPSTIRVGGADYVGAITSAGGVVVGAAGGVSTTVLHAALETDDHDNPAFLRRSSDGRIIAAYSKHSIDTSLFIRISTNPDDLSSFGAEVDIGSQLSGGTHDAYANLVEVSDGIFNFYRGVTSANPRGPHCTISTDNGSTWSTGQWLASNGTQRPYLHVAKGGANRIDIVVNGGNPGEVTPAACSLYHFYYEAGSWKKSDGTVITSPPFDISTKLTRIWDGTTQMAWSWDIKSFSGTPVVVYAVFVSTTDHRYRYAKWNGSSWDDHEICTAGGTIYPGAGAQDYYSGGVCIDPDNQNVIYCSRPVSGVHQIFKGVTADGGTTWTMTQLTFGSKKSFRPQKLSGSSTVTYVTGDYTAYTNFATNIKSVAA